MKFTRPIVLLINIVIILLGVILVLTEIMLTPSPLRSLLEAIGTGLIAAGGVNFLDRAFSQESKPDGVIMAATTRVATPRSVFNRKYKAEKIDIVGVSLTECLEEFVNDPNQNMIDRILFEHARLRLMYIHPRASFIAQRAIEDNISKEALINTQIRSTELVVLFYKQIKDRYDLAVNNRALDPRRAGSVQIKLIDFCPYITIDRADDEIYWGLYMSNTRGLESPLFVTTKDQNYALYDHLKKHVDSLLKKSVTLDDNFILSMIVGPPILNLDLAKNILGTKQLKRLLH